MADNTELQNRLEGMEKLISRMCSELQGRLVEEKVEHVSASRKRSRSFSDETAMKDEPSHHPKRRRSSEANESSTPVVIHESETEANSATQLFSEFSPSPKPWEKVDWKYVVCSLLGQDPVETEDELLFESLVKSGVLDRSNYEEIVPPNIVIPPQPPHCQILHSTTCFKAKTALPGIDTDLPFVSQGGHLNTKNRIEDTGKHAEGDPGLSFLIIRNYECCKPCGKQYLVSHEPDPDREGLIITAPELGIDLTRFLELCGCPSIIETFPLNETIRSPEVWAYHNKAFRELCSLPPDSRATYCRQNGFSNHFDAFVQYFHAEKLEEFAAVSNMLDKAVVSTRYLEYIFTPKALIVPMRSSGQRAERLSLSELTGWPTYEYVDKTTNGVTQVIQKPRLSITFNMLTWDYDGVFQTREFKEASRIDPNGDSLLPIRDLWRYPLAFADKQFQAMVKRRGEAFWSCRHRRLVEYSGPDGTFLEEIDQQRFMVDTMTFRRSAPEHDLNKYKLTDGLGATQVASEQPPGGNFVYLLPPIMMGYNLQDKKWTQLLTAYMRPVTWETSAFNQMVIQPTTKELIMALVTNKIKASKSTDIVSGKGNGLIVLLHGGPGTGKTLTAESVAEYAKKPLYRVTCGDIGTNPMEVERQLKHVLYLGKIWDCVVLLDEAEVFLQERSLVDLQRNALVSVFLRMLEYYDGILILTSNRVGTFDEGFKSRIQLSIHYNKLTQSSRKQIWLNFVGRLRSTKEEPIDVEDLHDHLDDLSKYDLNGREIRNAVTLGRQLAQFRSTALNFECIEHVVEVSSQFDKYLKKLNEGLDASALAREGGIRNE